MYTQSTNSDSSADAGVGRTPFRPGARVPVLAASSTSYTPATAPLRRKYPSRVSRVAQCPETCLHVSRGLSLLLSLSLAQCLAAYMRLASSATLCLGHLDPRLASYCYHSCHTPSHLKLHASPACRMLKPSLHATHCDLARRMYIYISACRPPMPCTTLSLCSAFNCGSRPFRPCSLHHVSVPPSVLSSSLYHVTIVVVLFKMSIIDIIPSTSLSASRCSSRLRLCSSLNAIAKLRAIIAVLAAI